MLVKGDTVVNWITGNKNQRNLNQNTTVMEVNWKMSSTKWWPFMMTTANIGKTSSCMSREIYTRFCLIFLWLYSRTLWIRLVHLPIPLRAVSPAHGQSYDCLRSIKYTAIQNCGTISKSCCIISKSCCMLSNSFNSQVPECTCSISHNAPFRTEMCTFLYWVKHYGIWNRCILRFVKLVCCSEIWGTHCTESKCYIFEIILLVHI